MLEPLIFHLVTEPFSYILNIMCICHMVYRQNQKQKVAFQKDFGASSHSHDFCMRSNGVCVCVCVVHVENLKYFS